MVGGVGAVAFANVMSKRSDDDNLIVATSTVGITQIAQNKYPGEADKMRWLAMLGADVGVVLVKPDAPWKNIGELLARSEEHTSELQSLMRISYAVFCLKKKT